MQVISGNNRGLKLFSPKDFNTRPTESRIKENIFNLLGQNFYGSIVLDLFSGTGQIGIEFISRGAEQCYFCDNDKEAILITKKNLEKSKNIDKSNIIKADYLKALEMLKSKKFDYIFIDPPYDNNKAYINSVNKIREYNLLKEDGMLILEQYDTIKLSFEDDFNLFKEKKYGNTNISIWGVK